ncbi:MAG TPA: DUF1844 domain-containing protein [Verrucomicrobiae bacterium]|nr:DUF1844 domain-containing protein [Verrucomicrobiae bacterium]
MSAPPSSDDPRAEASPEQIMSALFANLVVQQTNMALMLLGRMPHPETGETVQDIESAKMFIDQLEMIEFKTRGNLDAREDKLLQQSLTALRMAFVEAVDTQGTEQPKATPSGEAAQASASGKAGNPDQAGPPAAEEESRKKFTKKY